VIIATLLLIAIAVASGIVVYVFVNSLAGGLTTGGGQQTTERLQMQGYNFNLGAISTCACSLQVIQIFLLNSGSSSTTISAVYYDGALFPISVNNPPATPSASEASLAANVYTATTANCVLAGDTAQKYYCTNPPAGVAAQTTYTTGQTGEVEIGLITGSPAVAGSSHTVKIVSSTGATFVFSVTAGRSG
jgi:hypothetical protein